MRALIGLLLLAGCERAPAEAMREALAEGTPLPRALRLCRAAGDIADECVTAVVRAHPEAPEDTCRSLVSDRWRAECHFSVAEARAKDGDRWAALVACGQAGAYYDECLYHAWTFELQLAAEGLGRAVAGIEKARPIVAFWGQLQNIPDAEEQLWRDWWYFAHARNKPATIAWCAELPDAVDRRRCVEGTLTFVRRSVVETLIRPGTPAAQRDRLCRGDADDARALLGELYAPDPRLDAELEAGKAAACSPTGPVARPWNPVFRGRRVAG